MRASRKKSCAVVSYLLHYLHSFATEASMSEITLESCEFLCLVFCIVSFLFLFGGEYRKSDNKISKNYGIQHLLPCPHFLT